MVCRWPRALVQARTGVNNPGKAIVRHKHLIGCGFFVSEAWAAIRALRGADNDDCAGAHVARDQAVQLAPLLADGEPAAVLVTRTGRAIERPEATEF